MEQPLQTKSFEQFAILLNVKGWFMTWTFFFLQIPVYSRPYDYIFILPDP